jgi:hypothetical protein
MDHAETCDRARQAWFSGRSGQGARDADAATVADAAAIRNEVRDLDGLARGEAVQAAWLVECYMGWPMFEGVVLDGAGEPQRFHAWNVLPDGSVLDVSADLHGGEPPVVAPPGSSAARRYRAEWTPTYNPSLSARHPELEGVSWDGRLDLNVLESASQPSQEGPSPRV